MRGLVAFHNGMQLIRVGEMTGGITPRVEHIAKVWSDAGFEVKAFEDVHQLAWEKFLCNVTFSGPSAIMKATVGELMGNEDAWAVALGCGLEAFEVGKAKGINFTFDDPAAYITAFGEKCGAKSSMLQDHLAGRRSEIDAINGMVAPLAAEVGLSAPKTKPCRRSYGCWRVVLTGLWTLATALAVLLPKTSFLRYVHLERLSVRRLLD